MRIIIFGATGSVGKQIVNQAIEQGHRVTAFGRDATKLTENRHQLLFVQGNILDPEAVERAIEGHDAVLCAIGAGRKGGVRAEGTRNIIAAMEKTGVKRLICQSTLGVGDSQENINAFWKYIMFGFLIRPAFLDHVAQEEHVKQSTLDWTIVRPGAFIDGVRTGNYRHGFPSTDKTTQLKISRTDVADFMLKQLLGDTYLFKTPGLSY